MAKKLISVWLALTIVIFSSISIYAGDKIQGKFLLGDIVVNGNRLINYQSDNPFFIYNDMVYIPITDEVGNIMGFSKELDDESRTLKISKKEILQGNFTQPWMKNNKENLTAHRVQDIKVVETEYIDLKYADSNDKETHSEEFEANKAIDLNNYPVLSVKDIYYIPLKSLVNSETFKWDSYFDPYSGVYISTKDGVEAKALFAEAESRYNKGLVNYITNTNPRIPQDKALYLMYIFKHESNIYGVDRSRLMAVACKESTFNSDAVGGSGSVGIMQIMPSTAAAQGVSRDQLFDPHVSIEFAAKYLKGHVNSYNGDWTKALSAYNQGTGNVNRGSYNTRYANGVYNKESQMKNYLESGGYGNGK